MLTNYNITKLKGIDNMEKKFEIRSNGETIAEFNSYILAELYSLEFGGHIYRVEEVEL